LSYLVSVLEGETLLHLRGNAIPGFLQGQLTCDTGELAVARTAYGALCNAQGRVLADLRVLSLADDHYVLRLRRDIAGDCAATLSTYARFSRIECGVDDGSWTVLGLWGSDPGAGLKHLGLSAPEPTDAVVSSRGMHCYRVASDMIEVLLPTECLDDVLPALSAAAADAGGSEESWRAQELRAGIYRIAAEDVGEFTPQALNYDAAALVSFKKGCYTGQEVVARLHYRGASKRRLAVLAAAPSTPSPPRGSKVTSPDGATVGRVLRCARAPDALLLACELQVAAGSAPTLVVDDQRASVLPLPYEVPATAK
jgi:folate-binding protein YgfZ